MVGQVPCAAHTLSEHERIFTEPKTREDMQIQDAKYSVVGVGFLSLGDKVFQAQGPFFDLLLF